MTGSNPLKVVRDRTELIQLMEDVLLALLPKKEQQNEWVAGGLGILRGVAFRFWDEFPEHCTLPHILAFIMTASARQLSLFLQQNLVSEMLAGRLSEGGRFREDPGILSLHAV